MNKFISINLNQSESKETMREQWRERGRWAVFGLITFLLLFFNVQTWWIGHGYSKIIDLKEKEISEVKKDISALREQGKNLSKNDIMSLAELENNRVLWAHNMQLIGEMTPEDMALTSIKYKKNKIVISGVAAVYEDRKDFKIVHDYINKLKRHKTLNKNFSNIKFNQGSLKQVREQEVVEFEIEASIRVAVENGRKLS